MLISKKTYLSVTLIIAMSTHSTQANANEFIDKAIENTGDFIENTTKDTIEGVKFLGNKVVDGTVYVWDGTKYVAKKTVDGAVYAAKKTVDGAVYAAEKTVDGAVYVAKKTVDGAVYTAKKTADGAIYVWDGSKYVLGETVNGVVYVGGKAVIGLKENLTIPTVYAPDEKMGIALGYGLRGEQLDILHDTSGTSAMTFKRAKEDTKYAPLADGVYNRSKMIDNVWKIVDDVTQPSGFHASVYKNIHTQELVLAYQGTCAGDSIIDCTGDLVNDVIGIVSPSPQQNDALEYTKKMIDKYGKNITLTGHSLGGGLAQTSAVVYGLEAITFNSASVNRVSLGIIKALGGDTSFNSTNIRNYVSSEDFVNFGSSFVILGKNVGKTVYIKSPQITGLGKGHGMDLLVNGMNNMGRYYDDFIQDQSAPKTQKAKLVPIDQSNMHLLASSITSSDTSAIGSAINYTPHRTGTQPIHKTQEFTATDNSRLTTAAEQSTLVNDVTIAAGDWKVTEGDVSKHLRIGNSFGSITAPNGGQIAALNNADVAKTVMERKFTVPSGVRNVSTEFLANFVTNEYPEYVGTKFNDNVKVDVITGSGNQYKIDTPFRQELNSAKLTGVSNLPQPMDATGGQTGFIPVNVNNIPVAGGGDITIRVTSENIGDDLYPSAVLINDTNVGTK